MGVSINGGIQNGWFIVENPKKMMITRDSPILGNHQIKAEISWEIGCPRLQCRLHHSALCGLRVTARPQGQHVTQRHLWFVQGVPPHDLGVSIDGGTPKWMLSSGKSHQKLKDGV